MMALELFKLINRSERAHIERALVEGLQHWRRMYVKTELQPSCVLAADGDTAYQGHREWLVGSSGSESMIAIGLTSEWPKQLAEILLTPRCADELDAAGTRLIRDLGAVLIEEAGQAMLNLLLRRSEESQPLTWAVGGFPQMEHRVGSGFVVASIRLNEAFEWIIVLWPKEVLASLAPVAPVRHSSAPLERRSKAIQQESVRLDAIIGAAEVTVEELQTLAVGDVLTLDRRMSQPLEVRVHGDGVACHAHLGAVKSRAVLQLT